jgi:hypothetical protein
MQNKQLHNIGDEKTWQPSYIRRELSWIYPGIENIPVMWDQTRNKFDMNLLHSIYERSKNLIEFSGNGCLYDRSGKLVGFIDSVKNPIIPDPRLHVQHASPSQGRYTQNSQYFEKNAIWKTRNEIAYRCFVTGCEFTFDILFTPSGKSASLLLFENFKPHFKIVNGYAEAFDSRGLTKNVDEFMERLHEVINFAKSKNK